MCKYYQNLGYRYLTKRIKEKNEIINKLKAEGREKEIKETLKNMSPMDYQKSLSYVEDENFDNYMHDMDITQKFATLNRVIMAEIIIKKLKLNILEQFTTIHNYIDVEHKILRKGSISAQKGEKIIIPFNMRDGAIICEGKGNEDWNFSAPHGAGRIMSRSMAKEKVKLEDYQNTMKNVWSTSVNQSTIDESPFAYKPIDEIINNISDTANIINRIIPVYNFKAD